MTTKIYADYFAFISRTNKQENGVSPEFAELHPDFAKMNEANEACWNCSDCRGCSDCSGCSGCRGCSDCSDCSDCSGCSDCSDCSGCSGCSDCSDCSGCRERKEINGNEVLKVPIVENIHQKILEAVGNVGAFDMTTWHTCDTTHCWAGWAVHLAGEQGKAYEAMTDTPFAAMQIFRHSCPEISVSPNRFYESNDVAMEYIKEYAKREIELNATK